MTRSEQRQQLLALVYEKTFHDDAIEDIILLAKEARQQKLTDYIHRAFEGIFSNLDVVDEKISTHSIGWKLARIPKVPLCIMRIAVYEMMFEEDIPVSVSINEAVELAKIYGADDDHSYVNGVLGAISRAQ